MELSETIPDKESSMSHIFTYADHLTVSIKCVNDLYHNFYNRELEALHSNIVINNCSIITLVVLFNAGLWGYDDWIPTLDILTGPHRKNSNGFYFSISQVLVTSYTLEEAEDDEDTIIKCYENNKLACNGTLQIIWNIECEINPYKSAIQLSRHSSPNRTYCDNYAWQGFSIVVDVIT